MIKNETLKIRDCNNSEEVMEDLNNMIFTCIEPKSEARNLWARVEDMVYLGASEELIYRDVGLALKEYKMLKD